MRTTWDAVAAAATAIMLVSLSLPIAEADASTVDTWFDAVSIVHSGGDGTSGSPRSTGEVTATQVDGAAGARIAPVAAVDVTAIAPARGSACASAPTGTTGSAPSVSLDGGAIVGTSSGDLAEFALAYNAIRVAQCLAPIPLANFRYDSCMEQRLVWMAEDPSTDPASAWGHQGSVRSDGLPSVGCDGNLAGGSDNTGATVAQKWWDSLPHRASLYRPDSTADVNAVCIDFAMTHGGIPNEPLAFVRAAARWVSC